MLIKIGKKEFCLWQLLAKKMKRKSSKDLSSEEECDSYQEAIEQRFSIPRNFWFRSC